MSQRMIARMKWKRPKGRFCKSYDAVFVNGSASWGDHHDWVESLGEPTGCRLKVGQRYQRVDAASVGRLLMISND